MKVLRAGAPREVWLAFAVALEVTVRTLRNWVNQEPGRAGRPPASPAEVAAATAACRAVLEELGYRTWWRTVWERLQGRYTMYRVQKCCQALKAEQAAKEKERVAVARTSLVVRAVDALWSLDETHLGRLQGGEAVSGLLIREVASTRTLLAAAGPAATAEDLVGALERIRQSRRRLPLVLALDNGPAMKSALLTDYLAFHDVAALRNLPYVSEHNPWVENGHRRHKTLAELGEGVILGGVAEADARLKAAVACNDERRPLASRGFKTALVVDTTMPRWYARIERRDFYLAACRAMNRAVEGHANDRERRKAEREALLACMEDHALITRTRGGTPIRNGSGKSFS